MSDAYPAMYFEYAKLINELDDVAALFKKQKFLTDDTSNTIKTLIDDLKRHRKTNTESSLTWATTDRLRIKTGPNRGNHQPDGRGVNLCGAVEFKWEIKNFHRDGKAKKKSVAYKHFQIAGSASTRIYLYRINNTNHNDPPNETLCGCWNFDIGSPDSPGCHFHIQIPEKVEPWQYPLDIPRWPSIIFMPTDAIDFLLGELFPDEWRRHYERCSKNVWRKLQQQRLLQTLQWMQKELDDPLGSPWLKLRNSHPPADLLTNKI